MIDTTPIIIDPHGWYSDGQARLLLDLTSATMARARREGALKHRKVGHRILYLGQWLLDWLKADSCQGVTHE